MSEQPDTAGFTVLVPVVENNRYLCLHTEVGEGTYGDEPIRICMEINGTALTVDFRDRTFVVSTLEIAKVLAQAVVKADALHGVVVTERER